MNIQKLAKKGMKMAKINLTLSLVTQDGGEVLDISDAIYEIRRGGKRVLCHADSMPQAVRAACRTFIIAGEPFDTVIAVRTNDRPNAIYLQGSLATMARVFGLEELVEASRANDNDPADEESKAA